MILSTIIIQFQKHLDILSQLQLFSHTSFIDKSNHLTIFKGKQSWQEYGD